MFVTSIFLFVLYDRFSFDRLLFIHLTSSSSSSSRSSRSIRRALIIRIYENHIAKGGDRGRKLSASLCNIHPLGKKGEWKEWKGRKICARQISRTNRATLFLPLRFIALSPLLFLRPLFSGACSSGNTTQQKHVRRRAHAKKIAYNCVRSSSLSLSPFHPAHCSQEPTCTALCHNNVHCIFEQWERSSVLIAISTLFATLSLLFSKARPSFPRAY